MSNNNTIKRADSKDLTITIVIIKIIEEMEGIAKEAEVEVEGEEEETLSKVKEAKEIKKHIKEVPEDLKRNTL
jgi:hypothetical protein